MELVGKAELFGDVMDGNSALQEEPPMLQPPPQHPCGRTAASDVTIKQTVRALLPEFKESLRREGINLMGKR